MRMFLENNSEDIGIIIKSISLLKKHCQILTRYVILKKNDFNKIAMKDMLTTSPVTNHVLQTKMAYNLIPDSHKLGNGILFKGHLWHNKIVNGRGCKICENNFIVALVV